MLLEPHELGPPSETAASILASIGLLDVEVEHVPENVLGDPASILDNFAAKDLEVLITQLDELLKMIEGSSRFQPSRRDLNRAALYMCWYMRLSENVDIIVEQKGKWAAQNAFLHVFLPQMSPKEFNAAVTSLVSSDELLGASGSADLGVLKPRLTRLERGRKAQVFPDSVDFWASLS